MNLSLEKLRLLHAIRGFAALYVVICHAKFPLWVGGRKYIQTIPREEWSILDYLMFVLDMLSTQGSAMVIIFFVLSGFFIAYSFEKNNWLLKDFYTNRMLRIYIPYLASVLFAVLILICVKSLTPALAVNNQDVEFNSTLVEAFEQLNLKSLFYSLFFLPNGQYIGFNFVYWSLLYESIFYLIVPFVIKRPYQYLYFSISIFIISLFYQNANPIAKFFLDYSIYFSLGLVLYHLLQSGKIRLINKYFLILTLAASFLFLLVLGLMTYHKYSYIFAGLIGAGLITLFIQNDIKDYLILKFFKLMGTISYTLYLFHFPVLILCYSVAVYITGKYLFYDRIYWIGVLIAMAVSYYMYYLVEDKSLKLISKFKKKKVLVNQVVH
jgi:peptidoglycan/LPS O-acetylase OafA/YrhL